MNNKILKIILVLIGFFAFTHQAHSKIKILSDLDLTGGFFYNYGVSSGPGLMFSKNIKNFSVVTRAGFAVPNKTKLDDHVFQYSVTSYYISLGLAYTWENIRLSNYYIGAQLGLGVYHYKGVIKFIKKLKKRGNLPMLWGAINIKVINNLTLSLMANVLRFTKGSPFLNFYLKPVFGSEKYKGSLSIGLNYKI